MRPIGSKGPKLRAKTQRVYTFAVEATVPEDGHMEGKLIERALRKYLPNQMWIKNRQGAIVCIRARLSTNINEHFKRALERYRLAQASEAPRNPKVNPGGR